jgi:hypothetical protein
MDQKEGGLAWRGTHWRQSGWKVDLGTDGDYNMEQHFCHEGYVLPGSKVIAGRWCDTRADPNDETTASGPFIWWNVDRSLELHGLGSNGRFAEDFFPVSIHEQYAYSSPGLQHLEIFHP